MSFDSVTTDSDRQENHGGYGPEKWADLYDEATSFLQRVAVTLTPFAGLSSNALAHLRSEWITWKDDFVMIQVPETAECNQWKLTGGRGKPNLVQRESPCHHCKQCGNTDSFENLWTNKNGTTSRPYKATLHRDIARPAIEPLKKVFKTWNRPEIAATPIGVQKAVKHLVTEDGSSYSYSKLLRTGVVLYCHYGLSKDDIADLTPYTKDTIATVEAATPEVTREQNNSYTYLQAVAANEPASVTALTEELEVTRSAVRKTLKNLEEEGRVRANRDGRAHMWKTVGDWRKPFTCDICGDTAVTLMGIRVHRSHKH